MVDLNCGSDVQKNIENKTWLFEKIVLPLHFSNRKNKIIKNI